MLVTVPELLAKIRGELRILDAVSAFSECDDKSGIVIDVREPGEVQAKPADGSVNIPRGVLEMLVLEKIKDASQPIYIHCASGVRATLAAEQLKRIGYDDVTVISCGIDAVCEARD